ncbi:cobalt ECF transporter T component CbiQ [Nakamurella sp.]|uniref:cobalt ECF transporter T component CbiQ n=1 Tax=Nakamurella sp. TaxID=1869182 RepID=UPI003B3AC8EE
MAGGHGPGRGLFVPADSGVHRLAPECKVVATVLFVFAVVATPREAFWAFGLDAAVLVAVALAARVSLRRWLRRCLVEVPFLIFAVFLPFLGTAPFVQVGPLTLSEPGLWGAWNIAVKGTLGVAASALLTATTTVPDLLRALERLRVPRAVVAIATFMIRYGEVLSADLARLRIARIARGDDPRWIWQVRALARTAGALFVRAYERGERVYVAMLARGYGFGVPVADGARAPGRSWATALALPVSAGVVCAAAMVAG